MTGQSLSTRFILRLINCGLLCLGFAMPCLATETRVLNLYTEEYPPVTYLEHGEASGLGVAIVKEIMSRAGITAKITVVPWVRGYKAVLSEKNSGLFTTTRTAEREPLFKWIGPLISTNGLLYARKDAGIRISSLQDAGKTTQIAVPRGWYLDQILNAAGLNNLYQLPTPAKALKMLHSGRVQLAAIDDINLNSIAREINADPSEFTPVYQIQKNSNYLVLSNSTSDQIAQDCQKAFDSMREDGTLQKLYQKWLPGSTPPKG